MRKTLLLTVVFTFILVGHSAAFAAEAVSRVECPDAIGRQKFAALGLYDGNPREGAQLKPDNGDAPLPHVWSFNGSSPWVGCAYGTDRKPLHIRRLAKTVKRCETSGPRAVNCQ